MRKNTGRWRQVSLYDEEKTSFFLALNLARKARLKKARGRKRAILFARKC
jgi:hypothetical protein